MALSLKNPKTEELARKLARRTGESITEAVTTALQERLGRLERPEQGQLERRRVEILLKELWSLPDLDTRSAEEILGYDEMGVP